MPAQKTEEKNFGFLGTDFQIALIKEMIEDKKFSNNIVDVIENKYFDGPYFKYIVQNIKELHQQYLSSPSYVTIEQKIKIENSDDTTTFQVFIDTLNNIKNYDYKGQNKQSREFVQDTAMNFCKQQVLRRELKRVEKIIENGKFEEYNKIEDIIQKAMQIGIVNDSDHDIFEDIRGALQKDARKPIPTGIEGLDLEFKGGLALGELGVILAPTGIGKSTILSYFGNSGFNAGFNVLQVFFEDNERDIMLKHFTKWTGLSPDEQMRDENIENVIEKCENIQRCSSNFLTLSKYPSQSLRVSDLKNKLRKLKAEGKEVQLLLIDYLECLLPDKSDFDDEWKGEGTIMRTLEAMTKEFNIAIWVATQGGRSAMSSELVTADQTGGSIKKMQVGHVILTIGKTLEQKTNKTATMSIAKSRIGNDGLVYRNCPFDNEYMRIEAVDNETLLGYKEENEQRRAARPHELYKEMQKKILNHESKLMNMSAFDPPEHTGLNMNQVILEGMKPPLIDDVLKLLPEQKNNPETNIQNNFDGELLEIKNEEEVKIKRNRAAELYKFNTGLTKNSDELPKDRVKDLTKKKTMLGV